MNPLIAKIIIIGIPVLILGGGIAGLIVFIRNDRNITQKAKNTVSGLVFLNPKRGGGYALRLYQSPKDLPKPLLLPLWYKPNFLSPEIAFYLFEEDEEGGIKSFDHDTSAQEIILSTFGLFDLNSWDCQRDLLATNSGLGEALKTGAFVILAVTCLFMTYLIGSAMGDDKQQVQQQGNVEQIGDLQ